MWDPLRRRVSRVSIGVAGGDLAGDFGALFKVAADDEIGRRRAGAVALLEAAIAAVEACHHLVVAVARRALRRRSAPAPRCAISGLRWSRKCRAGNAARRGFPTAAAGRGRRAPAPSAAGAASGLEAAARACGRGWLRPRPAAAACGCWAAGRTERTARRRRRRQGTEQQQERSQKCAAQHAPRAGSDATGRARQSATTRHGRGTSCSTRLPAIRPPAAATICAKPFGGRQPGKLGGSSQCASANSSFSETSPAIQRAANGRMTKCRSIPPGAIAGDGLPIAGERNRRDVERGLLADFADHRLLERFAEFDAAARQRIEAVGRRPCPAHDQHAAVAEDGGADREIRPRRISPRHCRCCSSKPAAFRLLAYGAAPGYRAAEITHAEGS